MPAVVSSGFAQIQAIRLCLEVKPADLLLILHFVGQKKSLDLAGPAIFVRPGPRSWTLKSPFLSALNLGLGPKIPNFRPAPDLSSKGIGGGSTSLNFLLVSYTPPESISGRRGLFRLDVVHRRSPLQAPQLRATMRIEIGVERGRAQEEPHLSSSQEMAV